MQIFEGVSNKQDADEAVREAVGQFGQDNQQGAAPIPDILFVFHSSHQDAHGVVGGLAARFPDTLIVGCTTAGEWLTGQHKTRSLAILGLCSKAIRWSVAVLRDLHANPDESARDICSELMRQLDVTWRDLNPETYFCLSFFDGLSKREEPVIAAMANALGDIPLMGGSAGDDLKFDAAYVFANGKAYRDAAVFILAESQIPFRPIKHQHYVPGAVDTVITKADMAKRLVYRLDGMPAARRYAELLGVEVEELKPQVFSKNPLMYFYGGECYVRALRRVCEDGALEFGCAIEEGMVLNLCEHQNLASEYDKLLAESGQAVGKIKLLIVCNCIYRALEADADDLNQRLAEKTSQFAEHIIGFDTYGEQWHGLHMNQTLVALALGCE